ncbi:MAG: SUMF1/EgtB/PvdO family nonheme iron enzyme [Planctomycetes bacterium]|nr:SUMF1/EgtB/PvdO family nonheme iron enzyme [Planctomycetota bacterium]
MNAAPAHDDYVRARKELDRLESALLILKDPKARFSVGAPAGMALIEGGAITVESTYGFEADRRKARTKDFYIDLHEVTHGDYWGKFWIHLDDKILKQTFMPMVKDKDREFPAWIQDLETGEYAPLPEMMDLPVTGIDAAAALAFARSQGKRLPTEAEWLAAATATPGKCSEFPWGEDYREGLANDAKAGNGKAVPVAGFLEGRSFHGIHDCAGNVKEWTFTTVEGKDVEDEIPDGCTLAIRGGSFESSATGVSLKWRWNYPARNTRENDLGFRCARDLK